MHVKAFYAGCRDDLQAKLSKVLEEPELLSHKDRKACPGRYEVKLIADLGRRMEGTAPAARQPGASSAGVDEHEPHRRDLGHDAAGAEPDVEPDV